MNRSPRPGEQFSAARAGHHLVHLESEEDLLHTILNDAVSTLDARRGAIVLADWAVLPSAVRPVHREHNEPRVPRQQQRRHVRRLPWRARSGSSLSCTSIRSAASAPDITPSSRRGCSSRPRPRRAPGFQFEWKTEVAALDKAVEQSNVKFSHNQHLDPDRVLRRGDSKPLNCADCHRLEPDGEHFEPITMENRCAECHELTFDPGAPDRQLPHGKPREVVLTLQDYFTRKFSDPNAGRPTRERRRLPGHEEAEQTCSGAPFDCAMRSAHTEIENQFTRRGCIGCHVVVDTKSESDFDRYQVYPIRFARDYFPAGRFDHRSHQIQGKLTGRRGMLVLPQGEGVAGQQGPAAAGDGQVRGVPRRSSGRRKSGRAVRELSLLPSATDSRCRGAETMKKKAMGAGVGTKNIAMRGSRPRRCVFRRRSRCDDHRHGPNRRMQWQLRR